MDAWLVLVVGLPSHPSSRRVRAWRRLRALGAVALKNSVYVLPFTPESYEQLQWLTQEVQRDGGEATLLKVDRIETMDRAALVRLFNDARDLDYRRLGEQYRRLLQSLDGKPGRRAAPRRPVELARLGRELESLRAIDFFGAPGGAEVARLREALESRLSPGAEARAGGAAPPLGELRGRRWVTRPRPHVDRIASAWLVKRFVDPDAEFVFAPEDALPAGAVPFDVLGAELGHHGDDCTFETLVKRAGLRDRRLARLAEIVHEADLRDGKYDRPEARGIDLAIRGLLAVTKDDHDMLAAGLRLFDGLYASVGGSA